MLGCGSHNSSIVCVLPSASYESRRVFVMVRRRECDVGVLILIASKVAFWARHKIFHAKAKKFDNFRFRIFGFVRSTE